MLRLCFLLCEKKRKKKKLNALQSFPLHRAFIRHFPFTHSSKRPKGERKGGKRQIDLENGWEMEIADRERGRERGAKICDCFPNIVLSPPFWILNTYGPPCHCSYVSYEICTTTVHKAVNVVPQSPDNALDLWRLKSNKWLSGPESGI